MMHATLLALSLLMTPTLAQRQAIESRCECTLQHRANCMSWVCDDKDVLADKKPR
jgi:hypothetical protein